MRGRERGRERENTGENYRNIMEDRIMSPYCSRRWLVRSWIGRVRRGNRRGIWVW